MFHLLNTIPLLTFDDDCSLCTKFARFLKRLFSKKLIVVPMHNDKIMRWGTKSIGTEEYWVSFHMVVNDNWFSEAEAICQLASVLPLGRFFEFAAKSPPLKAILMHFLKYFQLKRKLECTFSDQEQKNQKKDNSEVDIEKSLTSHRTKG